MSRLSREELYSKVWAEPVSSVATQLSVSGVWLKKCCNENGVPVPDRGYWAKKRAGKPVVVRPLPPRAPGASEFVSVGGVSRSYYTAEPEQLTGAEPPEPRFSETLGGVLDRARASAVIPARAQGQALPKVIQRFLDADDRRRQKQLEQPYLAAWHAPLFDSQFERSRFGFLATLISAFTRNGIELEVGGATARHIRAKVGVQTVVIKLDAEGARADRQGEWLTQKGKAAPMVLELVTDEPPLDLKMRWSGDRRTLETSLREIVVNTLMLAESRYRANVVFEHRRLLERRADHARVIERQRLEAERAEAARLAAEAEARRQHLLQQARDWRTAQDLRGFVEAVAGGAHRPHLDEWKAWALSEAERLDPLTNGGLSVPA